MTVLSGQYIASKLPKRPSTANKGTFGKVLTIAGSENFPGAAYLACASSYRVGAGLVTLATDKTVKIIVSRKLPEVTFLSYDEVDKKIGEYDALLIGPGLGQSNQIVEFLDKLFKLPSLPKTVIDGDGLNVLSKTDNRWRRYKLNAVLTPHPGEMGRLAGLTIEEIQASREEVAIKFAKKWNRVVVLKGANTVIASPAGEEFVSPFANPALATAGTGDVLAGIIAGLLAQGLNLFDASCVGVYLHGLTGESAKKEMGDAGVVASDLLSFLPKAIKSLSLHNQTSGQSD